MKTSSLTLDDLAQSVLAVPPLARKADLSIDPAANARLIRHIEAGGIRTLLYGGNANLYHMPVGEYGAMLDLLAEAAGPSTHVIPSIGPDFGKMIEQAALLRGRGFPTAMVLPMLAITSPDGVADGIERVVDTAGIPVTLYLKSEGTLTLDRLQKLVETGRILCIKYAIARPDPMQDPFLMELIERIGRERLVSGMGEIPVPAHVGRLGLASFTTGSGCIAPSRCMGLLAALKTGDTAAAQRLYELFVPLETVRERVSLIRVLHDAITWSGIADMGAQLPLLSSTPADLRPEIEAIARELLAQEAAR